jgi:hypothetical protein
MEETRLMLLMQLIENLRDNFQVFESSYESSDKEKFDSSKKAMIEIQSKIKFLIENYKKQ